MERLLLSDGVAEIAVCPALGGALAAYDLIADGARLPLFRRAPPEADSAFALACNPLVPWSNRISGGGFRFGGRFYPLAPNWPGEPCPLHGNGFLARWDVAARDAAAIELALASDGPGPFRYEARLRYALAGGALAMQLSVVHRGAEKLPYGLGFHPWLPRTAGTRLEARASAVWLEDARHLPTERVRLRERPDWDFTVARDLPLSWINNAFVGWDGRATVTWVDRRLALAIAAEGPGGAPLGTYLLYSPGGTAEFFCFEPVSHPVDAHNLPGAPAEHGLFVLEPGAAASVACRFAPRAI